MKTVRPQRGPPNYRKELLLAESRRNRAAAGWSTDRYRLIRDEVGAEVG
jgi:hypothetical protein